MLLRLPREIRDQIYDLVLANHVIVVGLTDRPASDNTSNTIRLTHVAIHDSMRQRAKTEFRDCTITEPSRELAPVPSASLSFDRIGTGRVPFNLLLTCRTVYKEALPLLYSQNYWRLGQDHETMQFVSQQRQNRANYLSWIKKLDFNVFEGQAADPIWREDPALIAQYVPNVDSLRLHIEFLSIFDPHNNESTLHEQTTSMREHALQFLVLPLKQVTISLQLYSPHVAFLEETGDEYVIVKEVRTWARRLRSELLRQSSP